MLFARQILATNVDRCIDTTFAVPGNHRSRKKYGNTGKVSLVKN
jgi:hypothetical protein